MKTDFYLSMVISSDLIVAIINLVGSLNIISLQVVRRVEQVSAWILITGSI